MIRWASGGGVCGAGAVMPELYAAAAAGDLDAVKTILENKGPRNGPDPRGAGKLNRFRERLDRNELSVEKPSTKPGRLETRPAGPRPCRPAIERGAGRPCGLQAGGQ